LVLAKRRVNSNLQSPEYRDSLPYLPQRTGFSADPHLLTLLVEPLYGKHPSVGVRELMQNAVDAVRELKEWCKKRGRSKESLDLPDLGADVLVEFIRRENGTWFLRVTDRGIGMRGETLANYFLRAGASFRRSPEWTKEFVGDSGKPMVTRAGQFGVGAFAIFLLGNSFTLKTRHAGARADDGYSLAASREVNLIEIRREKGLPVGTTIEVDFFDDTVISFGLAARGQAQYDKPTKKSTHDKDDADHTFEILDWYCWDWPHVAYVVDNNAENDPVFEHPACPTHNVICNPTWTMFSSSDGLTVYWTFERHAAPPVSYNGFRIGHPNDLFTQNQDVNDHINIGWNQMLEFRQPNVAIDDRSEKTVLSIQRYNLLSNPVPFLNALEQDVLCSFIAYCLVCGPTSQATAMNENQRHPLQWDPFEWGNAVDWSQSKPQRKSGLANGLWRWCATRAGFTPADAWLSSLLDTSSGIIYGAYWNHSRAGIKNSEISRQLYIDPEGVPDKWFITICHTEQRSYDTGLNFREQTRRVYSLLQLDEMMAKRDLVLGIAPFKSLAVSVSSSDRALFRAHRLEGTTIESALMQWTEIETKQTRSWMAPPRTEPTSMMKAALKDWEGAFSKLLTSLYGKSGDNEFNDRMGEMILFVGLLEPVAGASISSPLAVVWNECLGPQAIPFDGAERKELIEKGRSHPDLGRHIDAWQKMKDEGSKWATGDFDPSECGVVQ
jgi:hypothetical protein